MIRWVLLTLSSVGVAASIGVWIGTIEHHLGYIPKGGRFEVGILHGVVFLHWPDEPYPLITTQALRELFENEGWPVEDLEPTIPAKVGYHRHPGVGFGSVPPNFTLPRYYPPRIERMKGYPEYRITIPLWLPALLCGVTTCLLIFPHRRRRRRLRAGLCVKCGYSLRGLTEPRCPECGTSFEGPA